MINSKKGYHWGPKKTKKVVISLVGQWQPSLSFKRKFSFRKSSIVSDISKIFFGTFFRPKFSNFSSGYFLYCFLSIIQSDSNVDSLLLHTVSSIICWIRGRRLVWIILEIVTQLNRKILGSDNYWLHDELSNPPGGETLVMNHT